jgi:hypothetical protein
VVDVVFCRGFCENGCAERGFLRGKCGGVVVNCVAEGGSQSALKNRTDFSHKVRFILRSTFCAARGWSLRIVEEVEAFGRRVTPERFGVSICDSSV